MAAFSLRDLGSNGVASLGPALINRLLNRLEAPFTHNARALVNGAGRAQPSTRALLNLLLLANSSAPSLASKLIGYSAL